MSINFKSLPYNIKEKINAEYEYLCEEYLKLKSKNPDGYDWIEVDMVEDIIFLGVFYRNVISPINGTIGFVGQAQHGGASNVQLGNLTIDNKQVQYMRSMVNDFKLLVSDFDIPLSVLSISKPKDFLYHLKEHWGKNE